MPHIGQAFQWRMIPKSIELIDLDLFVKSQVEHLLWGGIIVQDIQILGNIWSCLTFFLIFLNFKEELWKKYSVSHAPSQKQVEIPYHRASALMLPDRAWPRRQK